jgi:hypothetical protein
MPPTGQRDSDLSLGIGEYEVRRRQALETRFGVTTVLRAGPPTRTLPLPVTYFSSNKRRSEGSRSRSSRMMFPSVL